VFQGGRWVKAMKEAKQESVRDVRKTRQRKKDLRSRKPHNLEPITHDWDSSCEN
jgi:hypothetical protein